MRKIPILFLTLALCACATVPGPVAAGAQARLKAMPQALAAGDTIVLTLTNESSGAIFYNLCQSVLERRVGEAWEQTLSDRACTMELRTLEPGGQARYSLQIPPSARPGEYRFSTRVDAVENGSQEIANSNAFRVFLHD